MKYQGHKSYGYWNVSLWFANDEGLYRMALEHIRHAKNRDEAARNIMDDLRECGISKTPDGIKYSVSSIRAALVGLE